MLFVHSFAVLAIACNLVLSNPLAKRKDNGAAPGPVQLVGFDECSDEQQRAIEFAWDDAIVMAGSVRVEGGTFYETDLLGNGGSQFIRDVQTLISNAAKFRRDEKSDMKIRVRCDDRLISKGAIQPDADCPRDFKPQDKKEILKCVSRCWTWNDGTKTFIPKAEAYTVQNPLNQQPAVAGMNFCPSFFERKTCDTQISRWGNSLREDYKLHLANYECQGRLALHELFHVDLNYQGVTTPGATHAYDRSFFMKNSHGVLQKTPAYGPLYVRILAHYDTDTSHFYALTNADSLAIYVHAKYVASKIDAYPKYPEATQGPDHLAPTKRGKSEDDSDGYSFTEYAIIKDGDSLAATSPDDLSSALGVPAEDVDVTFTAVKDGCSDASHDCINDSDNKAIDLVPNDKTPTSRNGSTSTSDKPAAASCTTVTTLVWKNPPNDVLANHHGEPNSQNWYTMGFTISGEYKSVSTPETQIVWAGPDTKAATPRLGSAKGLPNFLVQTYDHNKDWVQYNYGSLAWASTSKDQCTDPGFKKGPKTKEGFSQRIITCTFKC